jgi:hypothetical protein
MRDLSPNYHANAGHAKAGMLTRKALAYLRAPTERADQKRDSRDVVRDGEDLLALLHGSSRWLTHGESARPDPNVINVLRDVDRFAVGVLTRTEGSGIQAAQTELREHISGALRYL